MLGGEQKHKTDNIHITSIAHGDDICLLASSNNKDLELMVRERIAGSMAAGLETGLDKNFLDQHDTLTKRHSER